MKISEIALEQLKFLRKVQSDTSADLATRVEASKALLGSLPFFPPQYAQPRPEFTEPELDL